MAADLVLPNPFPNYQDGVEPNSGAYEVQEGSGVERLEEFLLEPVNKSNLRAAAKALGWKEE